MTTKYKFGLSVLFAGLLLLSVVCISPAAAAIEEKTIEKNYVSVKEAEVHAKTALYDFVLIGAPGSNSRDWTNATVNPDSLLIYDTNGKKLFYQFTVENNGINIGAIKVAASKVLGDPIRTIEFYSEDWDMKKEVENAKKLVAKDPKNANVTSSKVVCYSYPKIGIMADIQESKSKEEKSKLFDFSGSEIIDKSINDTNSSEITDVWSLYSEIPEEEIEGRLVAWDEYDKRAKEIADKNFEEDEVQIKIAGVQKTLSFTRYTQENDYYCAPATGKMIANFYDVTHTQTYIAGMMLVVTGLGTSIYDQMEYYEDSDGLDKDGSYYDSSPTWDEAKTEIDNNRPLATLISGHTRACAGYCQGADGNNYLYIYDPWSLNFGNSYRGGIYWEDWDLITHQYHIYVKD
ncbi:C39 family peptidase [Methanosarcina sp. 2.H.A.1B.4]|uniref:C39 family peptidase n=1 Tax=Methanosarcina sp. 2.H.A.1B.4 TaxID=1483600 RepID=UPI0006214C36|nr:C39 family peptidase [Methanosarcina sp. 2.H.A.1B.4]KKG10855.1 hypothetical protein EO92_00505 [Methanosarcina sp. 2.H.A.1B.4]